MLRAIGRSDRARWSSLQNFESWWESRTAKMARLIPANSTVIEFGAGTRPLERMLDSNCKYIASDLVDRGPGTVVCDLNLPPLPDLTHLRPDVAVFAGVLEYIHDIDSLARWLSSLVRCCVVSYEPAPPMRQWRQRLGRLRNGYMNAHSEQNLLAIFKRAGFVCAKRDAWTNQKIFLLVSLTRDAGAESAAIRPCD